MPTLSTGVTHMVVADDFGGISAIVQWLSYVPKVSISLMQQFSLTTLLKKLNFFIFYFLYFCILSFCCLYLVQKWSFADPKDE